MSDPVMATKYFPLFYNYRTISLGRFLGIMTGELSGEGPAIVGERGRELVISPSGQTYLTGDSPELVYLKQGSQVIPNNKISASGEVGGLIKGATMLKMRSSSIETIIDKTRKDLISTIKNQPQWIFPVEVGQPITCRKGFRYSEYFNRHLK